MCPEHHSLITRLHSARNTLRSGFHRFFKRSKPRLESSVSRTCGRRCFRIFDFQHAFVGPNSYGRRQKLCGRSFDYESIAFRGKPLFDFRGGPLFFRLVFFRRSLALDLSLFCLSLFGHVIDPFDFILDNTVGNYSTANRQASFKTSPSIARVAAGAISFISKKNTL
jgi:hypothetical protein